MIDEYVVVITRMEEEWQNLYLKLLAVLFYYEWYRPLVLFRFLFIVHLPSHDS